MNTQIILVTHALTQWNVDGRTQGHTDTPLNETGRKMAELLADRLKKEEITSIYSSDLRRAVETAEPIARIKGLKVIKDKRLREGRWAEQERESEYPVLACSVECESENDVRERIVEALNEIGENNPGGSVLVVSHVGAVKQFITFVLETSADSSLSYEGKRTALNCLLYEEGKWKFLLLNDDSHLLDFDGHNIHANHG